MKREECEGFRLGMKEKTEEDAEVNIVELGFTQWVERSERCKGRRRWLCLFGVLTYVTFFCFFRLKLNFIHKF